MHNQCAKMSDNFAGPWNSRLYIPREKSERGCYTFNKANTTQITIFFVVCMILYSLH